MNVLLTLLQVIVLGVPTVLAALGNEKMGVARFNVMLNNELNKFIPSNITLVILAVITFCYGVYALMNIMKAPSQKFTYKLQIVFIFASAVSFYQGNVEDFKNMDRFYAFAYLICYFVELLKAKIMAKGK